MGIQLKFIASSLHVMVKLANSNDEERGVTMFTIPAKSIRGEKHFTGVTITNDYLKEGRESFSVEATFLPPTL